MEKYPQKTNHNVFIPFLFIILIFMTGCVGSFGTFQPNPGLLEQYREGSLPEDYNYYYCGRSNQPYAVVGIDKAYGFNDRVWFKIESESQVYKKIDSLSELHYNSGSLYHSDILDAVGKKIGVWFSYYQYSPVRVDPQTKVVEVFNPYNPNDDDEGSSVIP
jgi:hypothetical protein